MFFNARRKSLSLVAMLLSILLLIAGISMDAANPQRHQPMASISLACTTTGLIGGITAYIVSRLD